jgi:hypothetical protein
MGFKAFIILVWMAVPISAAAMLHVDMQRYAQETQRQSELCRERRDQLSRSTAVLSRQALRLTNIGDGFELRDWRRDWNAAQHQVDKELPQLASSSLNHYAATATLLRAQEEKLDKLVKSTNKAGQDMDYYLRGQEVLLRLADDINQTRFQARFYRMLPNGRGIYLLLQEQLAMLENRYEAQDREQSRLADSMRATLGQIDKESRDIQHALERVADRMAEDQKLTYAESIRLRYQQFSVQKALASVIEQAVPPSDGPSKSTSVLRPHPARS